MKVCFVLPRFARRPIGGYKIVYEYANRLSEAGHAVSILFMNENAFEEHKLPSCLRGLCARLMTRLEPRWFPLDRRIRKISGTVHLPAVVEQVDVCVATGAETVAECARLFPAARKAYLIQDFETWVMGEAELYDTFNAGFKNIVVSSWLEKIVNEHSREKCVLIKNPIDLSVYRPMTPFEEREEHSIGLLYHSNERKGLKYSIAALRLLREKYPDLKVYMFGTSEPTEEIPGLVRFVRDASQAETVELYNRVSVFMCSTVREGYGLTAMEAMACGAVVASTDYEGIHEYGVDGVNCLLSPVRNPEAMAENVTRLFEDAALRRELAERGRASLEPLDWKMAFQAFLEAIGEG